MMIWGIIEARLYASQSLDFVQDLFLLAAELLLFCKGAGMLYSTTFYPHSSGALDGFALSN